VLLKLADKEVTVSMAQPRMSLNVAHAVTVVIYEIIRQKGRRA